MSLYTPTVDPLTSGAGWVYNHFSSDPSATLSVGGGQASLTYVPSGNSSVWYTNPNLPIPNTGVPSAWSGADIVQFDYPGPAGAYVALMIGFSRTTGNNDTIHIEMDTGATFLSTNVVSYNSVLEVVGGSKLYASMTYLTAQSDTRGIPQSVGLALRGRYAYIYVKYAGLWELKAYGPTARDWTAAGMMDNMAASFGMWTQTDGSFPAVCTITNQSVGLAYDPTTYYQQVVLGDSPSQFMPGNEFTGTPASTIQEIVLGNLNQDGGLGDPAVPGSAAPASLGGRVLSIDGLGVTGVAFANPWNYGSTHPLQFSTELWINSTATLGGAYGLPGSAGAVFSDVSGHVPADWGMSLSGNYQAGLGWGTSAHGDQAVISPQANNDGQWHHLVGTVDVTTGNWQLYVDSVLTASGTASPDTSPRYGNVVWWIGSNAQNPAMKFCNAAMYPYILTPTQVSDHYLAGTYPFSPPLNLVATAVGGDAHLTWNLPTTGGTPYGYLIFRDGLQIDSVVGALGYVDVNPGTGTYVYTVAAWDGTIQVSQLSNPSIVSIASGTTIDVYGKFAPAKAYPPTLLIDATGIKPQIYMIKENVVVQT